MAVEQQYLSDVEAILSHRYDLGADYWTTPDKRLIKGAPFSTLECVMYLLELGMEPCAPVLKEAIELILSTWREDGRFQLSAKGAIYPCHTNHAAQVLCQAGLAEDDRVQKTLEHMLQTQQPDGGWRCNKFSFGRGPETEHSNPHPTLMALNAFRFTKQLNTNAALDLAVEFLLMHWEVKKPIGPCHYGIGSLFMQLEYPYRGYNLFEYVYVLSFYRRARGDKRFLEALNALSSKAPDGQIIVERAVPKLAKLHFCTPQKVSGPASGRYREIMQNMGGV